MKIMPGIFFLLSWYTVSPQALYRVTEDYFRASPFKTEFSQFLTRLIEDPALSEKDIRKKTDSTLFYLQGVYTGHAPFFFPSSRCKIVVAEQEEYTDSSFTEAYTFFVYQLNSYASPGQEGLKEIRQEFEKLSRRFKKGFGTTDQKELKNGNEQTGAIMNYAYKNMDFYPLTFAWATAADNKENVLALTIRFFIIDNKAYLPVPPDSP